MQVHRGFRACAAGVLTLAALSVIDSGTAANASSATLLRQAIANTNNARYYHELDTTHISEGGVVVSSSSSEVYDQVHNREQDHSDFSIVRPHAKRQSYSVDVVMTNNHTYYRSSRDGAGWKERSGYGYKDPASGEQWVRAPLRFSFLNRLKVSSQETTNGTLHVRYRTKTSSATASGTENIDVWVRAQGTPYIVRYLSTLAGTVSGKSVGERAETHLTGFNKPVSISAPALRT